MTPGFLHQMSGLSFWISFFQNRKRTKCLSRLRLRASEKRSIFLIQRYNIKKQRKETWHMISLEEIISILKKVYNSYDNIRLGIAGSYANNTAKSDSDVDIVIDGDSNHIEIMEYIKGLFNIPVDILWLDLLKKDDEELDAFAVSNGLPKNEHSVYKTVLKEVRWL